MYYDCQKIAFFYRKIRGFLLPQQLKNCYIKLNIWCYIGKAYVEPEEKCAFFQCVVNKTRLVGLLGVGVLLCCHCIKFLLDCKCQVGISSAFTLQENTNVFKNSEKLLKALYWELGI